MARMTKKERETIGKRLRAARAARGWDQAEVAKRAKVAIGTLQGIEWATRETRDSKLEKVARIFGYTLRDLARGEDEIAPSDPLIAGLRREDFEMARLYHDAETPVRLRAQVILRDEESRHVAGLAVRLAKLPPDALGPVDELVTQMEARVSERATKT